MSYQAGSTLTAVALNRLMGYAQPSTNDTFTTIKVLASDTVTFTAISTHSYKVSYSTQHSSSTTSATTFAARWIAGAGPITTSSAALWSRICQSVTGNDTFTASRTVPAGVLSGQVTIGMTGQANTGTITVYGGSVDRELLIEDLGP